MSILRIFADEAGTMPVKEGSEPFVAAAFSVFSRVPAISNSEGLGRMRKHQLVNSLVDNKAIPHVSVIRPFPGYGSALEGKLAQWETMGRTTRLMTGANSKYLRPAETGKEAIPRANTLWVYLMQDALHSAILHGVLKAKEPVRVIEIVLDQKTLGQHTKRVFIDQMAGSAERLKENILKVTAQFPKAATIAMSRVQFSDKDIQVRWESDPGMGWAADGLLLADALASRHFEEQCKPKTPTLKSLLADAGFSGVVVDRTDWVRSGIAPENLAKWESTTGLYAPR